VPQDGASTALVVLTTLPNRDAAGSLVRELLDRRLVACGTILNGVTSVYRWEGNVEEAPETQVVLKTSRARWDALHEAVKALHPYDVPELLALPVATGLPAYLAWVGSETTPEGGVG
jgi:periplasmic divalent cation tolerance protein